MCVGQKLSALLFLGLSGSSGKIAGEGLKFVVMSPTSPPLLGSWGNPVFANQPDQHSNGVFAWVPIKKPWAFRPKSSSCST